MAHSKEVIDLIDNSDVKDNLSYWCNTYNRLKDGLIFDYEKHIPIDELTANCLRKLIEHSSHKLNSMYSEIEWNTDNQKGNYTQ